METCRPDKPTINIFEILHLRKERYHNAMLAWLLDPEQSHGLDDAFLSRFLERVGVNYTRNDFQKIQAEYTLWTADSSTTRRPDIFIETRNHRIYVENKVFASSMDDQELEDQAHCIRDDARDKEFVHVLIVPRQRDIRSSTQAIMDEHDIRMLEWLELVKLLEEVVVSEENADPHARAILEQYLNYVKEHIAHMFDGFDVGGMQKYVEAAQVIWQLEKGESPKRQIEKFLTIVAEEVLLQLPGEVSSEWDFRIKEDKSWAPVSWAVSFTSEDYSDLYFCITIWYGSPADGLLRVSVEVDLYGERIPQLAKTVYECAKALGEVQESKEGAGYYLWEEGVVQWSGLGRWQSFRDRLVDRAVAWMTKLIPVIEERLQQLEEGRRAKKRAPAPR